MNNRMKKISIQLNRPVKGITHNDQGASLAALTKLTGILTDSALSPSGTSNFPADIPAQLSGLTEVLEKTRKLAYQSGYEEGLAAGLSEAGVAVEAMRQEFVTMLKSYDEQYHSEIDKLQAPFLQLAVQIAEKIIGSAIADDEHHESFLANQINKILSNFSDQRNIIIRINPTSLERLEEEQFLKKLLLPAHLKVKIVEDITIKSIGCIVESDDYIVDASLNQVLEFLYQELLNQGEIWKD